MTTKLNIHLQHGGLYGWCAHCSPRARRRALAAAVHADGYATTMRRLNVLGVYDKSRPGLERVVQSDKRWLRDTFRSEAAYGHEVWNSRQGWRN